MYLVSSARQQAFTHTNSSQVLLAYLARRVMSVKIANKLTMSFAEIKRYLRCLLTQ